MFSRRNVFALAAIVAASLPTVVAESQSVGFDQSVLDPLVSSFATLTTLSTMTTQTTFFTSTTSASLTHGKPSASHHSQNTSVVACMHGACLPKSKPTTTPTQSTAGSSCSQVPATDRKRPTLGFSFTDRCDAVSDMAEDCRVTLDCDSTSTGLYPTCDHGQCKCLAKPCYRSSMCLQHQQCRSDHDEHICIKQRNETDSTGTCGCQPRIADCLFKANPHHYCASDFNCTERYFSFYPEFPHCNSGDSKYPRGRCDCSHFDCERSGDDRDYEACKDLIKCTTSPLGHRPFCNLKYGNETKNAKDGYCTCVS